MRNLLEEFKAKLIVLGGPRLVEIYMDYDISHVCLLDAILAGVTVDEIERVINVETVSLDNNEKVEMLRIIKILSNSGGIK